MCRRHALTLVEVLIALLILGLVAVIALPRTGTAAVAPSADHLLRADLKLLRIAIARYHDEHGVYPGQQGDGRHPPGTPEAVEAQLTQYSNALGQVAAERDNEYRFGPYLRDGIPPGRLAPQAGSRRLHVLRGAALSRDLDVSAAWIYNCDTGQISVNSRATDAAGHAYDLY